MGKVSAAVLGVIFLNVFNAKYGLINSFVSQITGTSFEKNWFFEPDSAFITVTWSWLLYTGMIIILILAATSMLREFELIYLTTNGGPGDITLNLPLYLYKTSMTDNNYGYANMMGVVLIVAGVIVVYAINRLFKMNEADY